jgi:hypothetical protein
MPKDVIMREKGIKRGMGDCHNVIVVMEIITFQHGHGFGCGTFRTLIWSACFMACAMS